MSAEKKSGNRWVLVALASLFAGPLVLAWVLYFTDVWRPTGQAHHGVLMQPPQSLVQLSSQLTDAEGQLMDEILKGKWSLIQVVDGDCTANCAAVKQRIRQVRLALSHRRDRVQRVLVYTGDRVFETEDTGLLVINSSSDDSVLAVLDEFSINSTDQSIFVTDPLGNLFIVYPAEVEQKALLEDLKRLLRLSRIG